ncbi:MAG: septum formation family protein, partial [Dermatophilaceae bacterium]
RPLGRPRPDGQMPPMPPDLLSLSELLGSPDQSGRPRPLGQLRPGDPYGATGSERSTRWGAEPGGLGASWLAPNSATWSPALRSADRYPTAPVPVVPPPPSSDLEGPQRDSQSEPVSWRREPGSDPEGRQREPGSDPEGRQRDSRSAPEGARRDSRRRRSVAAASRTDGLAVPALVFSVIPTVVVGAVLAIASLVRIRRTRERGRRRAIAALVISGGWAVAIISAASTANDPVDPALVQRAVLAQVREDYPTAEVGTVRCVGEVSPGSTVSCTVGVGGDSLPVTVRRPEDGGDFSVTLDAAVIDLRSVEREYTAPVAKAASTDVTIGCPEPTTIVRAVGDTFTCTVTAEFEASTELTMTVGDRGRLDWQLASAKALAGGGWVALAQLDRGDCGITDESRLARGTVWAVNCSRPHDWEVYEIRSLPAGPWPGDDSVTEDANQICYDTFTAYTGQPFDDSTFDAGFYWPVRQAWESGDRSVQCYLHDAKRPTGRALTGSAAT